MPEKEFQIGDYVTLDRYNHIDNTEKVKIISYSRLPISKHLTYQLDVNGTTIESTGQSIMESVLYTPVADEDRHDKFPSLLN